jgi:hypothetical protein
LGKGILLADWLGQSRLRHVDLCIQ